MEELMMAIVFAVMVIVLAIFSYGISKAEGGHFDERQMIARGKAYKYGFFTMMAVLFVYFFYDISVPKSFIRLEAGVIVLVTFILGLSVFCIVAIWNEAYTYVEQKPHNMGWGLGYILLAVIAIFAVLSDLSLDLDYIVNGELVYQSCYMQLGMLVFWGSAGGTYLARAIANKFDREDAE